MAIHSLNIYGVYPKSNQQSGKMPVTYIAICLLLLHHKKLCFNKYHNDLNFVFSHVHEFLHSLIDSRISLIFWELSPEVYVSIFFVELALAQVISA